MSECKPLAEAAGSAPALMTAAAMAGRRLHSSTFRLNLSALYGIGDARRGCVAGVKGVFRVCRVFSCVRHGAS